MVSGVVIKQPAGLGDIFFCLKIAHTFHKIDQCDIIWPVVPQYLWIRDYIQLPWLKFVSTEDEYPLKSQINKTLTRGLVHDIRIHTVEENNQYYRLVPLQHADWVNPGISVMEAKYRLVNMDSSNWSDYLNFTRNKEKEDKLYYEILELKDDEVYIFQNKFFASPPDVQEAKFDLDTEDKIVNLGFIEGYTVFDWLKVIENASIIVTIDTNIQYLLEKMEPKAESFHCYLRKGQWTYNQIKDLFTINWNYLNL